MKKSLLVSGVAIACSMTIAYASQNAYAFFNNGPDSPGRNVITAIHHDFPGAKEVTLTEQGKAEIAQFTMINRRVRAIYTPSGRLLSTFITENPEFIPFGVQSVLEQKYKGYVPMTATEYISPNEHSFYVLLKGQKGSHINWLRVKSDEDGNNIKIVQRLQQTI